jgi:hypothetical protein
MVLLLGDKAAAALRYIRDVGTFSVTITKNAETIVPYVTGENLANGAAHRRTKAYLLLNVAP